MPRVPRTLAVLAALAAMLALAGCGDDGSSVDASASSHVPVSIRDYEYSPKHLTVRRGATLEVSNEGEIAHNLTIERGRDPREPSDALAGTGSFLPGGTAELRVSLPAGRTYSFACTVPGHRDLGLYGTLRVR